MGLNLEQLRRRKFSKGLRARLLGEVTLTYHFRSIADEKVRDSVRQARRAGSTWAEVAKALSCSKSSAYRLFRDVERPSDES